MNDHDPTELKKLLKDTLPPMANTELRHDLWPAMLRRLETQAIRVPWWDWALLAAAATVFVFFPGTIPALLYHL